MGLSDLDSSSVKKIITDTILNSSFCRATFGGATRLGSSSPWIRVAIRPVELRGERHLQFSYFDSHKDTTKNYLPNEADTPLGELLDINFAGMHLTTTS